jgi:chemotaxis protein methyltransferase CheR
MTVAINTREFDLLRDFIARETGISLATDKVYLVETRLREIMRSEGIEDFSALHEVLLAGRSASLKAKVLDAMTTNETLWFRDSLPFDVFRDILLPAYAAEIQQGKRKKIRIWSAACSTGQEPYSLVMTFLEAARTNPTLEPGQLDILATDYSDKALAQAKAGKYGSMAMSRGLPEGYRGKYFSPAGNDYEVNREIRDPVVFRKFNLQDSFVMMGNFDIILTRYVLIYFSDDFKREVLRKAHGALEKGGVLFVGSSESLPEGSTGFSLIRSGRATYYQKVEGAVGSAVPGPVKTAREPEKILAPARSVASSDQHSKAGLEKATEDLAEIVKRLQDMNARYSRKTDH